MKSSAALAAVLSLQALCLFSLALAYLCFLFLSDNIRPNGHRFYLLSDGIRRNRRRCFWMFWVFWVFWVFLVFLGVAGIVLRLSSGDGPVMVLFYTQKKSQ